MKQSKSEGTPVCVVTGGTSGIGLATARLFSEHGYQIAICGRRARLLDEAKRQIIEAAPDDTDPFVRTVDLNQPSRARDFAESVVNTFGRLDVLVNNAGFAPLGPFDEMDEAIFENVLNVNLRSVFHLTKIAWRQMLKQGGGVVVNISSLAAVDPFPGFSLYGASKAWIDLLTVALASEGAEKGIRVLSIRPGAVETPMLRGLFPDFPAEQCVKPEEVADRVWGCVTDTENFESGKAYEVTNQS